MKNLKKKIEQLLNGKFNYEQPGLLFSQEKISVTLKAGETVRGEVYFGTDDNRKIHGYITSSDRRLVPGFDKFSGTTVCLPYGVDASGMQSGESRKGWLCFTTDIGEYKLSFEIHTEKEQVRSSAGELENLDQFCQIAREDFREAYRLFTDKSFPSILKDQTAEEKALYAGMSQQPVTYQHLEEFLIGMDMKRKISVSLNDSRVEFYEIKESVQESVVIARDGWGHLRLDVETRGDFLEVEKHVITDEDFIGSHYELEYVIHKEKLGRGNQYGEIVIRSPYQELSFQVLASRSSSTRVNVKTGEKQHCLSLMKDYLEYRCGGMDFATWAGSSQYELNQLRDSGFDYPEYHLLQAYLYHMEKNDEAARQLLESYQDKSFTKDDLEFAGALLYLSNLTGLYKDKAQALQRIQNFYMQKGDSFLLFWILLQMDPEVNASPSKALFLMEEQFDRGCKNPILYLEAWEYISRDVSLLHRLSRFWIQVFLFAARKNLLTEELVMRLAYLSGYEKNCNESLYRVLAMGYDAFPSQDVLEAICKYIMKGNPRKQEYFRWFDMAVAQGLRITRLYEYYVETMDISYQRELPKPLLMYFAYNSNTLGDAKKAYIYASVIANKEEEPQTYENYRAAMKKFAAARIAEGRMNENYAVIYQEFLGQPKNYEDARTIAGKMFTNRLYCDNRKIHYVIVRHSQMAREEIYPCLQGIVYPRIYTEDAAVLFQDEKQRRYCATINYNMKKLLDEREMIWTVLEKGVTEPGVLLNYCENHPVDMENIQVFQNLVKSDAFTQAYKQETRKKILDFYAANVHGEDLDRYLKNMDYREYANVDRKKLLEVLISRGLFAQAYGVVEEFGYEGLSMPDILKLTSRMITHCEMAEDEELLSLAGTVYRNGIHDEVILQYLMKFRFGPVEELINIWKSAKGFDMETYELEERILELLMFTEDYRKDGELVLEAYVQHSGKERIIGAYLCQVSYGIFVKEFSMSPFVKTCLEKAYEEKWPVSQVCRLALFKELSREKDSGEKDFAIKKEMLEMCMKQNMIFAFFRRLSPKLLSPWQLDDKTYLECHAAPDAKVTLFYKLDAGLGTDREYSQEPMNHVYEGIFTKIFTLFYGETLRYYFRIEENGRVRTLPERVITMNKAEENPANKYQMINQLLSARRLEKDKELAGIMQNYLRREQYVKNMFQIDKE